MRRRKEGIILASLLAVFFLSSTLALAVDCPIPDTGQTKCYDGSTNEITCPSPGETSYGQDAQYSCNPPSYTSLAGGTMVQDNVTGLIWENKTDDGSIHDKDNEYEWSAAQSVFIATLNSQNFGGYSDWRLPTVTELVSILKYGTSPSIDNTYFPNTQPAQYWSSTVDAYDPDSAWEVSFSFTFGTIYKIYDYYARAVRGGECGSDFVDNGNSTVTDNATGLMWEVKTDDGGARDKDNVCSWYEALSYCENLSLAGYTDWRLPNIKELQSIVDYSTYSPSINTTFFPNTAWLIYEEYPYWSSTSNTQQWVMGVGFGYGDWEYLTRDIKYWVRAVRGGECGSFDSSTTTTISGSTTTTIGGGCPPESPIDCGNGGCCYTDYPVCCDDGYCYVNQEDCTGSETTTTTTPTTTTSIGECIHGECIATFECTLSLGVGWACVNDCCTNIGFTCPVSLALEGNEAQLDVIRDFRDNVLSQTPEGQELIKLYYQWSPVIVEMMEEDEEFREEAKEMIDGVLPLIREIVE